MPLTLYYLEMSPAVRSTLITIKALGLDVEMKPVNLMAGEHMTPEYLKMNPLHTVPTLKDDDFVVFDSHAINSYLVDKYGKDDSLYPKDLQKRATVNQRLFFDCGVLFPNLAAIVGSILRQNAKTISKDKADNVTQGYQKLESLLEQNAYVAGPHVTIADFSIVATITSSNALVPIASNRYPKISEWLSKMQSLSYYQEGDQKGLNTFVAVMRSKLS
ncbi:unnamed protein product [Callosobruchus maculatus]|uniref:Uncharacterized protein n=1 Tax=Callosobruchus maculatus TaxID=64391 RepID=A0A653DSH8_CALMS|nr:unnamed protein product [Callosobruchus maculatus]